LVFEEDKIIIKDKSKYQRNLWLILSFAGFLIGAAFVAYYLNSENELLLWIGLFYSIAHIIVFVFVLFRPLQSEIKMIDVKSLNMKVWHGNTYLEIHHNSNKITRVNRIKNPHYLQQYFDIVLKHKWNIQ
jgi:hypothetical protein